MKQILISLSCVEPWNTRHVTEAIIFSIPGLYALVCCGHSQASSELFCWPVVSHSSYSYWTSRRAWSWQGLNKCLFLPTLCILIWGAASLLHFDAFWPLVFASLCDKGPAQRWRVIVRERERDSTAAGFWRVLHRCTAKSTYYNPLEIDYEAMSSTTTTTTTTTTTSTTGTAITLIQLTTCEAIKMLGQCRSFSFAWSCVCFAQQPLETLGDIAWQK